MVKAQYERDIYVVNVGYDYAGEETVGAFTANADAKEFAKEIKFADSITIYRYRGGNQISSERMR